MDSSVFDNSNYFKVWMWCLLKATHEEHTFPFNGEELLVKDGEFITGRTKACEELCMTPQKYRSAIKYLKSTSRLTIKSNNKFSLIKVNKWEEYQSVTSKVTNEQPAGNQQITTYKNVKKGKNDKNIYSPSNLKNKPYKDFDVFKCNDGTVARLRFGTWVDDSSEVKLEINYYKELPKV